MFSYRRLNYVNFSPFQIKYNESLLAFFSKALEKFSLSSSTSSSSVMLNGTLLIAICRGFSLSSANVWKLILLMVMNCWTSLNDVSSGQLIWISSGIDVVFKDTWSRLCIAYKFFAMDILDVFRWKWVVWRAIWLPFLVVVFSVNLVSNGNGEREGKVIMFNCCSLPFFVV